MNDNQGTCWQCGHDGNLDIDTGWCGRCVDDYVKEQEEMEGDKR